MSDNRQQILKNGKDKKNILEQGTRYREHT